MVGVSNGAMMTLRFACSAPGVLSGIGSVAGTFTSPCDHPPTIPFIAIHGLADSIVDYEAGSGTVEDGPEMRLPAKETIERMEAADRCTDLHTTTVGTVHRTVGTCGVEVITVDGAGHQWPGATIDAARLAQDGPANQPSTAVDATHELWTFFAAVPNGGAAAAPA
jgi:polyhydroxybutyrate depolymerase